MLDFLSRGLLMDEAGDTGGGGTALETTTTETALTTTSDTDLETAGGDDATEESTEVTTTQPKNGRSAQATSTALQAIKATHPELARQIPRALGIQQRLTAQFGPEPFKALSSMQSAIRTLAGRHWNTPDPGDAQRRTGVQQVLDELADMEKLDLLYAAGDPRMIDQMTETPEARISFAKLMPHGIDKLASMPEGKAALAKIAPKAWNHYQQIAPNAYNGYMAASILSDMISRDIDVHLRRIVSLIPADSAEGKTAATAIQAYMERLEGLRKLSPETIADPAEVTKDARQEELDRREREIAKERKELQLESWKSSANTTKSRIFQQSWGAESKGHKIDAVAKEDIQAWIWRRLPEALKNEPGWNDTLQNFYENDDKDGYLRYLESMHAKHLPRIIRAEIARRFPTGAKAANTEQRTTPAAKGQVDPGFKRVSAAPHMNTVNMAMTRPDMWKNRQAILKTGDRVQW